MSAEIEPGARLYDENGGKRLDAPGEHEIELSKAISLKRIADALDKQNEIALGITQGFTQGDLT